MTSEAVRKTEHWAWIAALLGFQVLLIVMNRWWPGSPGQTLVRIACIQLHHDLDRPQDQHGLSTPPATLDT